MDAASKPLLKETLDACVRVFVIISIFGLCINLLMLTAPIYMMQVFDRVITSRSTDTLVMLMMIAGIALLTMAVLEGVRGFILVRLSSWLDRRLSGQTLIATISETFKSDKSPSIQTLRDLGTFRSFLAGPSMFPILDAPFAPIFLAVMFLLHPLLGIISLIGACLLFGLALANEKATRKLLASAGQQSMVAMSQAEAAARNADVIEAMGMMPQMIARWDAKNSDSLDLQAKASDRGSIISSISKFIRLSLQIGVTSTGAWLVIAGDMSPGSMIAASIIMGRALAPVEQAIGSWKGFLGARAAYGRLKNALDVQSETTDSMPLPRPDGNIEVEGLSYIHPSAADPILRNVKFEIKAGETLGIIGPSAAGKSTLARLLVGNLVPSAGHVRLDNMDIAQWAANDRGKYVGYLPQDIELFSGTVQENIARMSQGDPEQVITAAKKAGVHELVLRMDNGYDSEIGESGARISGGQRQRIGLARAVYGDPCLLILDEPYANLDTEGDKALMATMAALKAEGTTIIIIAHRPSILRNVDRILLLQEGQVAAFGPRDEILNKMLGGKNVAGNPLSFPDPPPRPAQKAVKHPRAAKSKVRQGRPQDKAPSTPEISSQKEGGY